MYKVSAPGSMMLLGEHSVLHNQPAIVFAVNKQVTVELIPTNFNQIKIESELGTHNIDLNNFNDSNSKKIEVVKPFEYVLQAIQFLYPQLLKSRLDTETNIDANQQSQQSNSGYILRIDSEIKSDLGLGSSAAITVATVGALLWCIKQQKPNQMEVFNLSYEVVLAVQAGLGSGADIAASIFGGVIAYENNYANVYASSPVKIEKLTEQLNITALYSGYKTKTKDVIAKVNEACKQSPEIYSELYKLMGKCTRDGIESIKKNALIKLGKVMNIYQGLLAALGVSDFCMDTMIEQLKSNSNNLGYKISGSGLGDCVIALYDDEYSNCDSDSGHKLNNVSTSQFINIPVQISKSGLMYG